MNSGHSPVSARDGGVLDGGNTKPDASGVDGSADQHDAGDGGSRTDAAVEKPPHPVSKFCGDAIRDPVTEECDDGPGSGEDSCTSDCRARSVPVIDLASADEDAGVQLPGPTHELGTGPHVASAGDSGFAIVYLEQDIQTRVWMQAFDENGGRSGAPIEASEGTLPVNAAGAGVAALPDGSYAVAWSEHTSGSPDVALRRIVPGKTAQTASSRPHADQVGTQDDPDLLWTEKDGLIVAWSDQLDIQYRRYDATLAALDDPQPLANTSAIESGVSLAGFDTSWAAAWRSGDSGLERIRVRAGSVGWVTPAAPPGPEGDRPALVALDGEHLLLVFTLGTDPNSTGSASVGRLRAAVLDTQSPGAVTPFELAPMTQPHASDATLDQRRPSLASVNGQLFLVWQNSSPSGDLRGTDVFLERLKWSSDQPMALSVEDEQTLPPALPSNGNQQNPRLAASPLFPDGALIMVLEDRAFPGATQPAIALTFRPIPWVNLPLVMVNQ